MVTWSVSPVFRVKFVLSVPQHWLWNSLLRNISPKVRPVGRLLQPPRPKQPFWDQVSLHRDIRNQIRCSKLLICSSVQSIEQDYENKGQMIIIWLTETIWKLSSRKNVISLTIQCDVWINYFNGNKALSMLTPRTAEHWGEIRTLA